MVCARIVMLKDFRGKTEWKGISKIKTVPEHVSVMKKNIYTANSLWGVMWEALIDFPWNEHRKYTVDGCNPKYRDPAMCCCPVTDRVRSRCLYAGLAWLARVSWLTTANHSVGQTEPPCSVLSWELSRFWLWSIREWSKGGYACTMPNKTKKDKVS